MTMERGTALLWFMLLLAGIGGWITARAPVRTRSADNAALTPVIDELLQARRSLIAHAVSYADNYPASGAGVGHLPCPDRDPVDDGVDSNDGPDPPCATAHLQIGRMPRFTRLPASHWSGQGKKLLDFFSPPTLLDQTMWYVVAPEYVNNPLGRAVNSKTVGSLRVDDVVGVAAILIAPGVAVGSQATRRPSDRIDAYLEGVNADVNHSYSQRMQLDTNDRIVYITSAELTPLIEMRVLELLTQWLTAYRRRYCNASDQDCFPSAARQGVCQPGLEAGELPLLNGSCQHALAEHGRLQGVVLQRHWFIRNDWPRYVRYERHPACAGAAGIGCIVVGERIDGDGGQTLLVRVEPESK